MSSDGTTLTRALDPASIAIVGASDNPDKVGGRPLFYLSKFGYRGRVYPVNPGRRQVQGYDAFARVTDLPEVPELAIIALPAEAAVGAVEECAAMGTQVVIVMSGGFAESGSAGAAREAAMLAAARATGMRIIGPNSQGLVNFATGTVASFSTMFLEVEPADGPVAILSQSGIMSVVPYALLRRRGIGVRHAHATGNGSDVTLAELALAVLEDPGVRLLLLYLESIPDPAALARVAAVARARNLPIVAVKSGRTPAGKAAAMSHTASLASEDRVVDAFLRHHGIWRASDMHGLVNAAALYLKGWTPAGRRLAVVSNSGATCVMAADAAAELDLSIATLSSASTSALQLRLPAFAQAGNPVDVTGALLGDSGLIGDAVDIVGADAAVDMLFLGIPVAGRGYDVARFARDTARMAGATNKPVVVATAVATVAAHFADQGIPTFEQDRSALAALAQLCSHTTLQRRSRPPDATAYPINLPSGDSRFLSEAASTDFLAQLGIPVVPWKLCRTVDDVRSAFVALGGPVVAKGCAAEVPHKSEHGLVMLDLATEDEAVGAFEDLMATMIRLGARADGVIVASMIAGRRELAIGARLDPQFGPVVLLGAGGTYVEALADYVLLMPPFDEDEAAEALGRLRLAPTLNGGRGQLPSDVAAACAVGVALGNIMLRSGGQIASIDLNPVLVGTVGEGACVADSLIERAHYVTEPALTL